MTDKLVMSMGVLALLVIAPASSGQIRPAQEADLAIRNIIPQINVVMELQAAEVDKGKRFESGMVVDPITLKPSDTIAFALQVMKQRGA